MALPFDTPPVGCINWQIPPVRRMGSSRLADRAALLLDVGSSVQPGVDLRCSRVDHRRLRDGERPHVVIHSLKPTGARQAFVRGDHRYRRPNSLGHVRRKPIVHIRPHLVSRRCRARSPLSGSQVLRPVSRASRRVSDGSGRRPRCVACAACHGQATRSGGSRELRGVAGGCFVRRCPRSARTGWDDAPGDRPVFHPVVAGYPSP
jgi:hypothetical protein